MSNEKRKRITLRFEDQEYAEILEKAKKNNMDISSYLRERLFGDNVISDKKSFEYKTLKLLSFCTGTLNAISNKEFPKKNDQETIDDLIKDIMSSYGLKDK